MRTQLFSCLSLLFLLLLPGVSAAIDFDQDISAEDEAAFDEILEPVMKIYNLVKYLATVIAALVLLFAGMNYVLGENGKKQGLSERAIKYLHDIADTKIARNDLDIIDNPDVKQEMLQEQYNLTREFLENEYDIPCFIKDAFKILGKDYLLSEDEYDIEWHEEAREREENDFDYFICALKNDEDFLSQLAKETRYPIYPVCRGNFSEEIMEAVLSSGNETAEKRRRIREYSNRIRNDFLRYNIIGVSGFYERILRETFEGDIKLREEIIEDGEEYGVEWKF